MVTSALCQRFSCSKLLPVYFMEFNLPVYLVVWVQTVPNPPATLLLTDVFRSWTHHENHVYVHAQMHSSCPTSCPDHVSQTCTLQLSLSVKSFNGISEVKLSSLIHTLLNKEDKIIPLKHGAAGESLRWSTCWKVGALAWEPRYLRRAEWKVEDPSVCQPEGGGLKSPPLSHLLYSLFPCCFDLAFTLPSMCARALSGQQECIMVQTKEVGALFMNY